MEPQVAEPLEALETDETARVILGHVTGEFDMLLHLQEIGGSQLTNVANEGVGVDVCRIQVVDVNGVVFIVLHCHGIVVTGATDVDVVVTVVVAFFSWPLFCRSRRWRRGDAPPTSPRRPTCLRLSRKKIGKGKIWGPKRGG